MFRVFVRMIIMDHYKWSFIVLWYYVDLESVIKFEQCISMKIWFIAIDFFTGILQNESFRLLDPPCVLTNIWLLSPL